MDTARLIRFCKASSDDTVPALVCPPDISY